MQTNSINQLDVAATINLDDLIYSTEKDMMHYLPVNTMSSISFIDANYHCVLLKCKLLTATVGVHLAPIFGCLSPWVQDQFGYAGLGAYVYDFQTRTVKIDIRGVNYVLGAHPGVLWSNTKINPNTALTIAQSYIGKISDSTLEISKYFIGDTEENWIIRGFDDFHNLIVNLKLAPNGTIVSEF